MLISDLNLRKSLDFGVLDQDLRDDKIEGGELFFNRVAQDVDVLNSWEQCV